MHLVFATSLVPVAEPRSGYDIANRVIVDALRMMGHRVSVVGYLQPGNAPSAPEHTVVLAELEVTNARVTKARKAGWMATALARGEPVSVAKMHAVPASRVAAALAAVQPVDAVILNSVQLPGAFFDLFSAFPYLYVAHNVEGTSAAANAREAESVLGRVLFAREARLLNEVEGTLCQQARFVFTLAEADRKALGVGDPERSCALPLVTSVTPPPGIEPRSPIHDIGLIGSWTWSANRAGLDWFLDEVVPRLPQDITVAVAGGMDQQPDHAPANVEFLGRVPDARTFVRSAHVIPLISRAGTGVQLKTIETFELGLPSVATSSALRGIVDCPANCHVADDADDFAAKLLGLVRRSRAGEQLDVDGRAFHASQLAGLEQALGVGLAQLPLVNESKIDP
jgi:glycosyl transferase family 1